MSSAIGTTAPSLPKPALSRPWLDYTGVLVRWVLGGIFVYMGLSKALHPEMFLKLLRQYNLTGNSLLLNSIAAGLPWLEVFCGLLLLAGIAVRGSALLLLLMLIPFGIVLGTGVFFIFCAWRRACAVTSPVRASSITSARRCGRRDRGA